ncbi:MAG TPA: hypothetical protein VGE02_07335 [Gemmatimonadales bacterium]
MMTSGPGRARALVAALVGVVGVVGCASASVEGAPAAAAAAPAAADTTDRAAEPVIQIREFPASPLVTIVAWSPDDAAFGLRAEVNRDGVLVGGRRNGDHTFYVSTAQVDVMGGFARAWVDPVPPGPVLLHYRGGVDRQACNRSDVCAPMSVYHIQMPDDLLRQHRDSMVVTFSGGRYRDWRVVLDSRVIGAYLRTVDSVVAENRAP